MSTGMTLEEAILYLQWGPSPREDEETACEKLAEADHIIRDAARTGILREEEAKEIILNPPESHSDLSLIFSPLLG